MKRSILSLIAVTALLFTACKKDKDNNPGGKGDTYQPTTAGSVWKYRNTLKIGNQTELDTTTTTMTATKKTINGKSYFVATSNDGGDNYETYLSFNNDVYSTIMDDIIEGENVEFEYLNANKAINDSWNKDFTFEGEEGDINARFKTTIVEKGISKTVLEKAYTNVIHSKIEVQFKAGNEYTTISQVDFYTAKGVGIIGMYTGVGANTYKSELFNYTIK